MRSSIARDSGQLDPRCSTTDIPPPQSATLGLHPVARELLLISRHAEGRRLSWPEHTVGQQRVQGCLQEPRAITTTNTPNTPTAAAVAVVVIVKVRFIFVPSMQAFKMPGDELPKTPPKSPDKPSKPDDVGHITHKAKKLDVKEPVSVSVSVSVSQLCWF